MSFEGYYQRLCENGHYSAIDVYAGDFQDLDDWECAVCDAPLAWEQLVDETNGIDPETGECPGSVYLEIAVQPKICICKECGHTHEVDPPRYTIPAKYKIPEKEGHKTK